MKSASIDIPGFLAVQTESERDSVILTNQLSLLLAILPLIYIALNVYDQGWARITIPILIQPIFFLLPIVLNYCGLTVASKVWLSWIMPLQAMIFSIYNKSAGLDLQTSHYMGVRFSILASSVIPFLVFRLREVVLLFTSLSVSFVTLVWFDFIHASFGVGYYQVGLKETGYALTTMRVLIAFVLATGGSLFLKRMVEKKEFLNGKLISELIKKNREVINQLEKIESQNEQISRQKSLLENQKAIIEKQNNTLLDSNRELEIKVGEKTRDLLNANAELEKQNLQLEQFAFMAAHNLRSPVARIIGLSNILNESAGHDPLNQKIISLIKTSSADLDNVIHDLISVVQVKSRASFDLEQLKISVVIDKVLQNLKPDIEANFIEIENEVAPGLEFNVNGPFAHSVFTNIVDNSIKYRDENKVSVISIRTKQEGPEIELEIADNGIGFDAELYKDRICKPFSRLNTVRSGKGLGLYLAKIQLESMGGHLSIRSKPDHGTVVTLKFQASDRGV